MVEPNANMLEILIRNIYDVETIANTFYTLDAGDFRGEESMRVLDVNHLNLGLAGKLNKTALNSAEFALQMVKVPEQMANVILNKEATVIEDMLYHDRDLQPQYWRAKLTPLPGQYVGMLFEKVTEQKEREIQLVRSEQRFRELFNGSPGAIFVQDLDGTILDANPAACR